MDDEDREEIRATVSTSTFDLFNQPEGSAKSNNLIGDHLTREPTIGCQTKPTLDSFGAQTIRPTVIQTVAVDNQVNIMASENKNNLQWNMPEEEYCNIKLDSLQKLKDSTKKLIYLLEEIQSKTHSNNPISDNICKMNDSIKHLKLNKDVNSISDMVDVTALKQLEIQAKYLDGIYIEDAEDDCSVFKRLTRKCNCLNHKEYNDFVIHFNEDTKYSTSTLGELVKNIRILKKFLYMGGGYTKNALLFLNEGLSDQSTHAEKVDIVQACSHADICNVFDDNSIVTVCILWPFKYDSYGDSMTQALAAAFLCKISNIEEGRRYLNFSSKILNDVNNVLRKKSSVLEFDTCVSLNSTVTSLNPPMNQHINITYYCKAEEGMGNRTLLALVRYGSYMTFEEIFAHLDLLHHISKNESGKKEMTQYLPSTLCLFRRLLIEYDNSEMNLLVTNILNNIVSKNTCDSVENYIPHVTVTEISTEPIKVKCALNQVPSKKNTKKIIKNKFAINFSSNKNQSALNQVPAKKKINLAITIASSKSHQSKRKSGQWESHRSVNRSKLFAKGK